VLAMVPKAHLYYVRGKVFSMTGAMRGTWEPRTFFSRHFADSTGWVSTHCPNTTTARCQIVPGSRITGHSGLDARL
jgi:hypothetical protein